MAPNKRATPTEKLKRVPLYSGVLQYVIQNLPKHILACRKTMGQSTLCSLQPQSLCSAVKGEEFDHGQKFRSRTFPTGPNVTLLNVLHISLPFCTLVFLHTRAWCQPPNIEGDLNHNHLMPREKIMQFEKCRWDQKLREWEGQHQKQVFVSGYYALACSSCACLRISPAAMCFLHRGCQIWVVQCPHLEC